jgi:hypothetical protein
MSLNIIKDACLISGMQSVYCEVGIAFSNKWLEEPQFLSFKIIKVTNRQQIDDP